jgi:hypothetical protein
MAKSRQRPTPLQSLGPGDEGLVLRWVSGEELSDIDLERLRRLLETSEVARELLDAVLPNGRRPDAEEHFPEPIGGKPARTRTSLLTFLNKQPPGTRYYFRGARRILESSSPLEALLAYVFAMDERVQRRAIRLLRASDRGRGSEARKTIVKGVEEERLNRFAAETELAEFLGSRMPARVPAEARAVRNDFMHGRKVSAAQILSACCVVIEWCTLLDKAVRHSVGQGPMDDLRFKPRTTNVDGVSDPNPPSVASTSRRKSRSESPEAPEDVRWRTLVNLQNTVEKLRALPMIVVDSFADQWDPSESAQGIALLKDARADLDAALMIYAASVESLHDLAEELGAPQPTRDRPSIPKRQDIGGTNLTSKTLRGLDPGAIWSAVRSAGLVESSHDLSSVPSDERVLAIGAALKLANPAGIAGRTHKRGRQSRLKADFGQLAVAHGSFGPVVLEEFRPTSVAAIAHDLHARITDLRRNRYFDCCYVLVASRDAWVAISQAARQSRLGRSIQACLKHHVFITSIDQLPSSLIAVNARVETEPFAAAQAAESLRELLADHSDRRAGKSYRSRRLRGLLDMMGWLDISLPETGPVSDEAWAEIIRRLDDAAAKSDPELLRLEQASRMQIFAARALNALK